MKIPLKYYFLFFLLPEICFSQVQFKIDSLEKALITAANDSEKVNILNKLSMQIDITGDYEKSMHYALRAESLAVKNHYQKGLADSYHNIAGNFDSKGDYEKAMEFNLKALKIRQEIGDKTGIAASCGNIGIIYDNKADYNTALEYYFKALKMDEETGNKNWAARNMSNIGNIHEGKKDYDKAMEYYFNALKLFEETGDKQGIGATYINLGNVNYAKVNFDKSMDYYLQAVDTYKKSGEVQGMSVCYNNIGKIFIEKKGYGKAMEYFLEALKIKEEIGDKTGMSYSLGNIGHAYLKQNNIAKAKEYYLKELNLAREIMHKQNIISSYESLSECDSAEGNFKGAYEYHKLYLQIKDSVFDEESTNQINEMQTKYETEKKDTEIKLLNKDKEIQTEELKQQKIYVYSAITVLVLVLTLAFFIYRSNRQKQLANVLLERKNNEVLQSKHQIENKNKELENANSEIIKQKKEIEEKNEEVFSSIRYAKRIQQAVLKAEEKVTPYLPDHFVLFKPKDIVSGDFYWATEKKVESGSGSKQEQKTAAATAASSWYVAVADCTGHGVPGAFLTMLGISFLNEITAGEKILSPSEILEELRNRFIKELGQTGKEGENKDGMDISLIALNLKTFELQWAGANNALYIISSPMADSAQSAVSLTLQEIKPDKQPIGYFPDAKPFTNHTLQLQKGDSIYIFSDGYADQFGGPKGKKFKYSQFEKLLVSIQEKQMKEQKEILNEEIEKWKGNIEQIDDICVIGIRV